ncbi:hypothetical protein QKU48_gp0542 [Fadolivirus algeromassiliense]|uniref:Uncharacterized protein n=1 Tax=Fadolivirus FV1/VV64 TaxID=3070911 RepID=A0A7D3QX05_9VIRU|nr:hypothetical protein QKU48_gp0542 [Fadolivirus algeromassiliense]QKF94000.1 hypothetical protein Fadolivirus_1_542 [Fadolivirus FV1/VV64]
MYCYIYKPPIVEGYDARYDNTDFGKCAEFCKTTMNCGGFGYDKVNKICYPSQLPILGRPLDSIFKREYSYGNATCNKIKTIDKPNDAPTFEDRRSNAVYVCTESHDKHPQYYFHNNNEFKNIGEGKNIDEIFDVEKYEVKTYRWPRNRFDYNQLDLLVKERENQTFTPENVTDLDRIVNYVPPKEEENENPIAPKINIKPQIDFNLDKMKDNIYDIMKKAAPSFLIPTKKYEVPREPTIRPNYITYNQSTNQNTGNYLMDYKCIKDIPLKDCMDFCSSNEECAGFEWNPSYDNKQNICCPYKSIGEYIPRKEDKISGKFYRKEINHELNINKDYIST